jgi:hypothetical protein
MRTTNSTTATRRYGYPSLIGALSLVSLSLSACDRGWIWDGTDQGGAATGGTLGGDGTGGSFGGPDARYDDGGTSVTGGTSGYDDGGVSATGGTLGYDDGGVSATGGTVGCGDGGVCATGGTLGCGDAGDPGTGGVFGDGGIGTGGGRATGLGTGGTLGASCFGNTFDRDVLCEQLPGARQQADADCQARGLELVAFGPVADCRVGAGEERQVAYTCCPPARPVP